MKYIALQCALALTIVLVSLPAVAQTSEDSVAIRQAALDYAEGYYEGSAERMERALHPDLAKRIVRTNPENGRSRLDQMSALTLVQGTRAGWGTRTPEEVRQADVEILDIFNGTASVKTTMHAWVDYMHIAKWQDEWKIVNVLWQTKPEE